MEKLKMHSGNVFSSNIEALAQLFPDCITEAIDDNGQVVKAVDFDKLKASLSYKVVEGVDERYNFTWPQKSDAIRLANARSSKTLRPCREESLDFENTGNLYIEGDNLDVLKVLRNTYRSRVKMIYIDPPYNTGNDFVYEDDFSIDADDYLLMSNQRDEQGNRLVKNTETNGRFHTDWLNMLYPRLRVARELLSDDGLIFISIGDEEEYNLRIICNEIFGEHNYVNTISVRRYNKNLNKQFVDKGLKSLNVGFEYIVCYKKNGALLSPVYKATESKRSTTGYWKGFWNDADRPTMRYELLGVQITSGQWKNSAEVAYKAVDNYKEYLDNYSETMTLEEYWNSTGCSKSFIRRNPKGKGKNMGVEMWIPPAATMLRSTDWNDMLASKHVESTKELFDSPKNPDVLELLLELSGSKDGLILDFFSGSASTAHAVMQLNAKDGGSRKFIMVQLPEEIDSQSETFQAGYKTICDIGKNRIRQSGANVKTEFGDQAKDIDVGFRVLKLDSSNMEDAFYLPHEMSLESLLSDNIKLDRTSEDLLFQSMLETDVLLSSSISVEHINNKEVFVVRDGYLMACFDEQIDLATIKAIAERKPVYFITRDGSMGRDDVADNMEQLFMAISPNTTIKVI